MLTAAWIVGMLALNAIGQPSGAGVDPAAAGLIFERNIAPLLVRRCLECHDSRQQLGGLDLTQHASVMAGGESGKVVQPFSPSRSVLLQRLMDAEMPPPRQGQLQRLPESEITMVRDWIAKGAFWPEGRTVDLYERTSDVRAGRDWWSLQPIDRPTLPPGAARHPIDRFIQSKLKQYNLTPAPKTNRRTQIRRLYFDLVGLPPSFDAIEEYVNDNRADAYEQLVDELIASPQLGVRWARHWLDVARYAETSGYERDQEKPFAWRYRDWVVNAINSDLPYDTFVHHQIAGDLVSDANEQSVIATGFLRLGTWNDEPNDPNEYQYERLEDLVHTTTASFLGLTVKCARCHDHKFDPVRQQDYYRIAAVFWNGPIADRQRELLGGPSAKELGYANVLGWTDTRHNIAPLNLLRKGDPRQPEFPVQYTAISAIPHLINCETATSISLCDAPPRLEFAHWITNPKNPLTSRVIVNRLWQHYFGSGIVDSTNNLGFQAPLPTHPQLLDWLATELMHRNWQLKPLHRMIVLSDSYRQSSVHPNALAFQAIDASNRFLWRANRRRLDAEALRDAILTASGHLDNRLGGFSFKPSISAEATEGLSRKGGAWQPSPTNDQRRRSLYIFAQRSLLVPIMTTFDFCSTTASCGKRDVTTVPTQALALMNNPLVARQSQHAATLSIQLAGPNRKLQIEKAWQLGLQRLPTGVELAKAHDYLIAQSDHFLDAEPATDKHKADQLALASLCQILMNANEFIYVD